MSTRSPKPFLILSASMTDLRLDPVQFRQTGLGSGFAQVGGQSLAQRLVVVLEQPFKRLELRGPEATRMGQPRVGGVAQSPGHVNRPLGRARWLPGDGG